MKLLFAGILIFAFSLTGTAQILNVEQYRTAKDTAKALTGDFNFSATLNKNQQTLFNFNTTGHIGFFTPKHFYLFITNISLIRYEENSLFNDGYFHLRSNFLRDKKISPEIFGQYQYDRNRGMLARWLAGAGGRIRILRKEKIKFFFGTGLMNEYEEWQEDGKPVVYRNLIKSSSYLSLLWELSENTSFSTITYYQVSPANLDALRLFLDNRLTVGITEIVSVTISFTGAYDREPVVDIEPWTYELMTGLAVSW